MPTLATTQSNITDLTQFDSTLQLGESEPLGTGVKRVTMEQLERAARGFFDRDVPFGGAIHESRKSIKRVRALLRLIRGELPKKVYRYENRSLRDTARLISEIRSAQGVLDAATSIHGLYGDLLAEGTFADLIERLFRRRDLIELRALEDPNLVSRVARRLERAHGRYGSWNTDSEAREIYGQGLRDTFDAVSPGLSKTYTHGRKRMVEAYRGNGSLHEWRKRVKDLRHQMEFLVPLWPEVVVGTAVTLERLGDILGDDNDIADLMRLLRDRPDLCPDPRERSLLVALGNQRRHDLQIAAEVLGRRVYGERPGSVTHRFGEYWDARQMAIEDIPDTIVVY